MHTFRVLRLPTRFGAATHFFGDQPKNQTSARESESAHQKCSVHQKLRFENLRASETSVRRIHCQEHPCPKDDNVHAHATIASETKPGFRITLLVMEPTVLSE